MDSDEINNNLDSYELPDEERELFEHFRIVVDRGQAQLRIDKYLSDRIGNKVSRNRIQSAARAECILVNGKAVKPNYKIKPADEIVVVLPQPPHELGILPEEIPLTFVYEDQQLAVVEKEAGMVVHPGFNNFDHTLVNALLYHFSKGKSDQHFPLLVHRIDKDTSGLLLVAKEEFAQTYLAKQFFDHTIDRLYRALVWGDFDEDSGTISG
ncbi:MAG: RluA family pseudouridine synthase, partial [Sphingobacteriia bacterium]|nr:RluA family pseudouridine synthase [Sphingobacteriia bacterium]